MKIYVGIDIAKLNHFAAAISSDEMCIRDSASPYVKALPFQWIWNSASV